MSFVDNNRKMKLKTILRNKSALFETIKIPPNSLKWDFYGVAANF